MTYVVPALVALALLEAILAARWYGPYFTTGLVIYRSTVPLDGSVEVAVSAERLTKQFRGGFGPSLEFHDLSPDDIGFRETLFELKLFSYTPVMHGLLRHQKERHLVTVEGRANWFTMVFSVGAIALVALQPVAWPVLPFLAVFLGGIYAVQVRRYDSVARAAAEKT